MKTLKVTALRDGTVIDHIPAQKAFSVAEILNLENADNKIILASNLPSKTHGKKAIIKISKKELSKKETNMIALFAPKATINIIEEFNVKEKRKVSLPDKLMGIVKCFNPNCITNQEEVETTFKVVSKDPLKLCCHHCERIMQAGDVVLL